MLLWIRNLKFKGGIAENFFISGEILLQYEAIISVKYGSEIPVKYEPDIKIVSDGDVSI